jgi:ribonuclease P protein component
MLPKKHRLQLRQEAPFFTFPYRAQSPNVRMHWRFDKEQTAAQAAVVVSKKNTPTAVQRNRLKRIVRATLTPLLPLLPSDLQLVVFPKSSNTDAVRRELQELLSQRLL